MNQESMIDTDLLGECLLSGIIACYMREEITLYNMVIISAIRISIALS